MRKAGQRHQGKQNGFLSSSLFVRNSFPSIGHALPPSAEDRVGGGSQLDRK